MMEVDAYADRQRQREQYPVKILRPKRQWRLMFWLLPLSSGILYFSRHLHNADHWAMLAAVTIVGNAMLALIDERRKRR